MKIPTDWETFDLQAGDVKPDTLGVAAGEAGGSVSTARRSRAGPTSRSARPTSRRPRRGHPDRSIPVTRRLRRCRCSVTWRRARPPTRPPASPSTPQFDLLRDDEVTMSVRSLGAPDDRAGQRRSRPPARSNWRCSTPRPPAVPCDGQLHGLLFRRPLAGDRLDLRFSDPSGDLMIERSERMSAVRAPASRAGDGVRGRSPRGIMSDLVAPPSAWPDQPHPRKRTCTCPRRRRRRRRAPRCRCGTAPSSSACSCADLRVARLRRGRAATRLMSHARRDPQRPARRSLARGALRTRSAPPGPLPAVRALAGVAPLLDRARVRRLEPLCRTVQPVDAVPHRPRSSKSSWSSRLIGVLFGWRWNESPVDALVELPRADDRRAPSAPRQGLPARSSSSCCCSA